MRSELELFSLPPLHISVEEGQWVEYNPVSTITSSVPIEFVVTGSGDESIYLNKTLFGVKAVIKRTNGNGASKQHTWLQLTTHYILSSVSWMYP